MLIRKHILGSRYFETPYQMIAADVNGSGSITVNDMVAIRRLVLHIDESYANVNSWRFVDANHQFGDPMNALQESFTEIYNINDLPAGNMSVDFVAVKVGDVNNSALVNDFGDEADDRNQDSDSGLSLRVDDQELVAGTTVEIAVRMNQFEQFHGYQYAWTFDASTLRFQSVTPTLAGLSSADFGLTQAERGTIYTSLALGEPTSVKPDAVFYTLRFEVLRAGRLRDVLGLGTDAFRSEAYDARLALQPVTLQFTSDEQLALSDPAALEMDVQPNPFRGATRVDFTVPKSGQVQLEIFDRLGQRVWQQTAAREAGHHRVDLDDRVLPESGTYLLRLRTETHHQSIKLVKI